MKKRHIKTELPGPKARALIARDAAVVSPSYPRDYPFVMSHGRGTEAWDVDGNRFLDFSAGIAVCATGHAHPEVVAAVRQAAGEFLHVSCDYYHEGMVALGERLARLAPMGEPAMSFSASKYTQQKGFFPAMPGVTHVPFPNAYRPLFAGADQGAAALDYIRMLFDRNLPPSEVAAILIEPIQGEGGYVLPPDGFLAGLRALCDEHGI